jgi:hypothetical protein
MKTYKEVNPYNGEEVMVETTATISGFKKSFIRPNKPPLIASSLMNRAKGMGIKQVNFEDGTITLKGSKSKVMEILKDAKREKLKTDMTEDAPTNATGVNVAGTGDDSSVVVVKKKKRKQPLIDARTKSYRLHREKLKKMREKRSKFREEVVEQMFQETALDTLQKIVRDKQAQTIRFKDGSMKVDMTTANIVLKVIDKIKNPDLKKKVKDKLKSGKKIDFQGVLNVAMKALR